MTEPIALTPIGVVRGDRSQIVENHWGAVVSRLVLDPAVLDPAATDGLSEFSTSRWSSISTGRPGSGAAGMLLPADPAPGQVEEAQARWAALAIHGSGAHVNVAGSASEADLAVIYPPATYQRLAAVKQAYDPAMSSGATTTSARSQLNEPAASRRRYRHRAVRPADPAARRISDCIDGLGFVW